MFEHNYYVWSLRPHCHILLTLMPGRRSSWVTEVTNDLFMLSDEQSLGSNCRRAINAVVVGTTLWGRQCGHEGDTTSLLRRV